MVELLKIIFWLFFLPIVLILSYEILLFFSSFFVEDKSIEVNKRKKFLILIPAFREGEILFSTIEALKKLNYPENLFEVILINDECKDDVISQLKNEVKVLNVELSSHSKIESLKKALSLAKNFDFVVILDADNLVHPDFLLKLNNSITSQTKVIQGLRLPKNLHSIFEKIDAITDYVYNQIDRIIPSKLGFSGTISGSGFAISIDLFRDIIPHINIKGGFDKVLQSELLLRNIPIEICRNAIVFDEKTTSSDIYKRQRTRWLYYHFFNSFKYGLKLLFAGIYRLNFNQFHLGLISLRPPINFIYFLSMILIIAGLWICSLCSFILTSILIIFTLMILHILNANNLLSLRLILYLPLIFLNQIYSILKFRDAKLNSLPTKHIHLKSIDEILKNSEVTKENE
jgi:cellulose synthase/poly-beta-1,6-N-acetylglucosamine synthase-like glycosyltransferase